MRCIRIGAGSVPRGGSRGAQTVGASPGPADAGEPLPAHRLKKSPLHSQ